ncbi:hypothetical protein LCGC14_1216950 [marine sediment metagenome]|uniref:Uncharacterized protein n=1 Tax=marine sediment metagenome TaxID=412755 RepID=A0A0F9NUR1_9ZZZZ
MPPSVRVRVTAKAKTGPCEQCPDEILKGERYVTVIQTFGKSKGGKTKYKAVRVHFTCLAKWLICEDLRYGTRVKEKGGRPKGTGMQLSDPDKKQRRHLTRTSARLMRLLLETDDVDRIKMLTGRITVTSEKITALGGALNPNLIRRSKEAQKAVTTKLKIGGSHVW